MKSDLPPPPATLPLDYVQPPLTSGLRLRQVRSTMRSKILLILALSMGALFVLLYIPLRTVTLQSFASLEEDLMHRDVTRARNVMTEALAELDRTTRDYASWDDTYAFIADHNTDYLAANFPIDNFVANDLNMVVFVDTDGHVVHGEGYDLATRQLQPLPTSLQSFAAPDAPLLQHRSTESSINGLLPTPDGLVLLASRPILTSAYSGPIRGSLIMGRWLDAAEIEHLAYTAQLSVTVVPLNDPTLPSALQAAIQMLDTTEVVVQPLDATTIVGYTLLKDVMGQPCALLRVVDERRVAAQGQASLWRFTLGLGVSCVVFGLVLLGLLEGVVLARLSRLTTDVQQLGQAHHTGARVSVRGDDELAHLGHTMNETLDALERAEAERRMAEAASMEAKDSFVAMVSHELRTPLTSIRGYIDLVLLMRGDLSAEQQAHLQTARTNTVRMTQLVEDLLEIGRLDAGRLELSYAPVNLAVVVADVIRVQSPEVQRRGHTIIPEVATELPLLEADEKRVRQILTNLLSNAVKYTPPEGTIWIRVRASVQEQIELEVADTGVGLTAAQQAQLFTRFYRADHTLLEQVEGIGLGLAITKALIELHGGTICVHSALGKGSTFVVTLPTAPSDEDNKQTV